MVTYMSRARKKSRKRTRGSYYRLSEVIQKIDSSGDLLIRENAEIDAFHDFGWEIEDIKKAYRLLKRSHFIKTEHSIKRPGFVLDCYKGLIMGENIYTHFYIDDNGKLVINSFKQDNTC